MIGFIKKLFGGKAEEAPVINTAVEAANSAPYKIEEPVVATPVAEVAPAAKKPAAKKQQFAKKTPAKKKPAASKPAV